MSNALLTDEEYQIVSILGDVWNKFLQLPELHPCDNHEFMHAIHAAQCIVLSRLFLREKNQQEGKEA